MTVFERTPRLGATTGSLLLPGVSVPALGLIFRAVEDEDLAGEEEMAGGWSPGQAPSWR